MDLRRASAWDAALAAEVYLASRKAAGDLIPASVHDDEDVHRWMREVFLPNAEVWFAVEDGRVIGLLGLQGDDWLEQLYVVPEAQGLGVGSALVDLAKQLRPRGIAAVGVRVEHSGAPLLRAARVRGRGDDRWGHQ